MKEKIKIIIADNYPAFALGLEAILKADNIEIIGKAITGEDVLSIIEYNIIDVAVISMYLPKLDGLELAEIIKVTYPSIKIVLLSDSENDDVIKKAKRLGIEGYVNKHDSVATIKDVVLSVVNGYYKYIEFVDRNNSYAPRRMFNLTFREMEILKYSGEGKSSKEVGKLLNISRRTVEHHRLTIRKKLKINSSVGYLRAAIKYNLLKL